jgi:hypothetical protein
MSAACSDTMTTMPTELVPGAASHSGGTGGGGGGGGVVVGPTLTGTWQDPTVETFSDAIFVGSPIYDVTTLAVRLTAKQSGTQITGELRIYQTTIEYGPDIPPSGNTTLLNAPIGRPAKVTGTLQGNAVTLVVTGDMLDSKQPNVVRTLVGTLSVDGNSIAAVTGSIYEFPSIGTNWSFVRQ